MNLQDFFDRHGIAYDTSGRGKNRPGWLNTRCTVCGRFPYLGINLRSLYATAWCCGYIPLAKALSVLSGKSIVECKALIGELPHEQRQRKEHSGNLQLPTDLGPLLPAQEDYLRGRGFDPKTLSSLWQLQGIGPLGRTSTGMNVAWRILIPIHLHGQVVSWTTRRITNTEPRYVSAKDSQSHVPIECLLYGIDYVQHAAIVVEGPVDCWRIGPGAVGMLGLRMSNRQLVQLAQIPLCVFCFDSEPEAQDRAAEYARLLSVFPGRRLFVRLESGKDAASARADEIQELRRRFLT